MLMPPESWKVDDDNHDNGEKYHHDHDDDDFDDDDDDGDDWAVNRATMIDDNDYYDHYDDHYDDKNDDDNDHFGDDESDDDVDWCHQRAERLMMITKLLWGWWWFSWRKNGKRGVSCVDQGQSKVGGDQIL